jgi:toxin ParE1/3/4
VSWRFTRHARRDLRETLAYTLDRFGPRQAEAYAGLVDRALEALDGDHLRPGTRAREELGAGVRSVHLAIFAAKRRGARHVLFYRPEGSGFVVLRLLHERQEPDRHVPGAAGGDEA